MRNIMVVKDFNKLNKKAAQEGATLLVSLIILLLLTVVGMASMDVTTVDVKVAANSKDRQLAFNAADDALFNGGVQIFTVDGCITSTTAVDFVGNTYSSTSDANTWWSDTTNWADLDAASDAEFVIEDPSIAVQAPSSNRVTRLNMQSIGDTRSAAYYPTTARAHGPGGSSVVLESYFMKLLYANNGKCSS